jgi:hypothetical protein
MTSNETNWTRPLDEVDARERDLPDDGIQHGIDDDPNNDAVKGAALGGIGGMAVGAAAGAATGMVGAILGAVVGGAVGAVTSGAAVGAIDQIDNDDTVAGYGDGVDYDKDHDPEAIAAEEDDDEELMPRGYVPTTLSEDEYESVWTGPAPIAPIPGARTGATTDAIADQGFDDTGMRRW